jgi:hypothetical protein
MEDYVTSKGERERREELPNCKRSILLNSSATVQRASLANTKKKENSLLLAVTYLYDMAKILDILESYLWQ